MAKKRKKRKKAERRLPRLRSLVFGGVLAAVAGFIALVMVYGAMGGGTDDELVLDDIGTDGSVGEDDAVTLYRSPT